MIICNNCGSLVIYDVHDKSWVCIGCKSVDPPIEVRPHKPEGSRDLYSTDMNVLSHRMGIGKHLSIDYDLIHDTEDDEWKLEDDKPVHRMKEKDFLLRR